MEATHTHTHKLEGCRGLNNFSIRLGVITEFCRGDTNVTNVSRIHLNASDKVGVHPGHPGWDSDEGYNIQGVIAVFASAASSK